MTRAAIRLLALLALAATAPARAQDAGEPPLRDVASTPSQSGSVLPGSPGEAVGTWDLSLDGTNRRCEITLSGESGPDGNVLRFPAGCRRALPLLAEAAGWLYADKAIRIVDRNIYPLVVFAPTTDARSLRGQAAHGQAYSLVPLQTVGMFPNAPPSLAPSEPVPGAADTVGPARAPEPPTGAGPSPAAATGPGAIADIAPSRAIPGSQPVLRSDRLVHTESRPESGPAPGGSQAALQPAAPPERGGPGWPEPGVYALDRFNEKDVCRIELATRPAATRPAAARETEGGLAPARILPGCRDGGITVFDPVSWRFAAGHLTLKAKRGHAVNLVATGDGGWRRDPDTGVTLVLRKVGP